MVPIILDPQNVSFAVIGEGDAMARRVQLLKDGGAQDVVVLSAEEATSTSLADRQVVFIAGLDEASSSKLAAIAKDVGALVNVEDVTEYCDFHMPATVRRGDLLLTVSTGGKSPGLARHLRQHLEGQFDEEWAAIVTDVAEARQRWIGEGADMKTVASKTAAMIDQNGYLA